MDRGPTLLEKLKGKKAEKEFASWLQRQRIPYVYIQQDLETFSKSLGKDYDGRRPDFIVFLHYVGPLFVDVKKRQFAQFNGSLYLPFDCDINDKYLNIQHSFNIQIWYAVTTEKVMYKKWYWLPSGAVEQAAEARKTSGKSGKDFYRVPVAACVEINLHESLDKLSKFF